MSDGGTLQEEGTFERKKKVPSSGVRKDCVQHNELSGMGWKSAVSPLISVLPSMRATDELESTVPRQWPVSTAWERMMRGGKST